MMQFDWKNRALLHAVILWYGRENQDDDTFKQAIEGTSNMLENDGLIQLLCPATSLFPSKHILQKA